MSEPTVSINVPCYHQLGHARAAVDSMLAQTLPDFEVTLLDDGGSDEYRAYVESLRDSRVRYCRNPERLGAMGNMFAAIEAGRGRYTLAFHEDDLLHRDYLGAAVEILDSHPSCAFVACELREFKDEPPAAERDRRNARPAYDLFASGAELVRGILRGVEPMFGSVVYRRAALAGVRPAHDLFATLVDRPFLLAILHNGWSGAVIREPLVWYRRHHQEGDTRHLTMTTEHVLRLFQAYRALLPAQWNKRDRALFFSYTGYWLFELYRLTPPEGRPSVRQFLFRAWRDGLYDPRSRGRFGLRQIGRALFNRLP
jgi:glycosyltransferase involved in cell wall biosynthesis